MPINSRPSRVISLLLISVVVIMAQSFDLNHFEAELDTDPFFGDKYQDTYDPLDGLEEVDSEPDFTYRSDHISPDDVDLPIVSASYRKAPQKRRRRMTDDDDFFDSYDHYFDTRFNGPDDHEHDGNDDLSEGESKKKNKKAKKTYDVNEDNDDDISPAEYAYTLDFNPSSEYERIKKISDEQRDQLKKDPSNCKEVHRGDELCYECIDPKTGDTSESCNYSQQDDPKKFAYAQEKSFHSKTPQGNFYDNSGEDKAELKQAENTKRRGGSKKVKKIKKQPKSAQYNAEPESYEQNDDYDTDTNADIDVDAGSEEKTNDGDYDSESFFTPGENYDDQAEIMEPYKHSFFYSSPTHEENRRNGQNNAQTDASQTYPSIMESQKDVDTALAEFKKRDWSSCTKIIESDLTCYKCVDANGVSHQECMYISESKPESSRIAYNGSRNYRSTPEGNNPYMNSAPLIEKPYMAEMRMAPVNIAPMQVEPMKKKKTKKVVIVKRKKMDPGADSKPEDSVVEEKTIKRTLSVTVTGDRKGTK